MTLIGKLLVFLVLLLALAWNALVVNAFVTRNNWKKQADTYQAEAGKAAEAAGTLRKLVDAERAASEDTIRVLREDRDRQYQQLQTVQRSYDDINKAYQERQTADKLKGQQENQLQANVKTLQEQVKFLTDDQAKKDAAIDAMTLATEKAKADMVKAQIDAQVQQRRAEQLNERLQQQLADRNSGTPNGGGLAPRPPAPTAFRGTVRARSGDLVSFTPGADTGLQTGTVLTVRRLAPVAKYVGKLKVVTLDPKEGVGQFIPPPTGVRVAADYPQPGDELVPE